MHFASLAMRRAGRRRDNEIAICPSATCVCPAPQKLRGGSSRCAGSRAATGRPRQELHLRESKAVQSADVAGIRAHDDLPPARRGAAGCPAPATVQPRAPQSAADRSGSLSAGISRGHPSPPGSRIRSMAHRASLRYGEPRAVAMHKQSRAVITSSGSRSRIRVTGGSNRMTSKSRPAHAAFATTSSASGRQAEPAEAPHPPRPDIASCGARSSPPGG